MTSSLLTNFYRPFYVVDGDLSDWQLFGGEDTLPWPPVADEIAVAGTNLDTTATASAADMNSAQFSSQRDAGNVDVQAARASDSSSSVSAFAITASTAQCDLLPENISVPTTVAPGASFSVSWLLANQGSGAANSTSTTEVRINQSTTSAAGTNLAGVSTAALAGNSSVSQSATITAPTAPGTYFVWVLADDFSNVTNQSSTSNDLEHSAAFTVSGGGGGGNPTTAYPITSLQQGSQSWDVLALQNWLINQGYLAQGDNTGFYGPLTQTAVTQLQNDLISKGSLSAGDNTGNYGPLTEAAMQKTYGASTLSNGLGATSLLAGFDREAYPTSPVMATLYSQTNLRWSGYYLERFID